MFLNLRVDKVKLPLLVFAILVSFWPGASVAAEGPGSADTLKVNVKQARPGVAATNGAVSTPVQGAQISAAGGGTTLTATTDAEGGAYFALGPGSYTLTVVSLPGGLEVGQNCLDTTSFSVGAVDEQWQWDVTTFLEAEQETELPGGSLWFFQGCGNQVPPVQRGFRAPAQATAASGGTGASANDDDERAGGAGSGTTSGGSSAGETPSEEAEADGAGGEFPLVPVLGGGLLLLGAGGFFVWSRQRTASQPPPYETLQPEPSGPMVTNPQPAPTEQERRNTDLDLRKAVVITPENAHLKREVDAALGTTGKTRWLSANDSDGRIVLGVDVSVDGELLFPRGFRPIGPQTPTILRIFVWPATETSGPRVDIQAWDTRTDRAVGAKSSDSGAATVNQAAANVADKVAPDGVWPVHEWWSEDHPPEVGAAALWPPYKPTPEEVGASIFDPEVDELPADVLDPPADGVGEAPPPTSTGTSQSDEAWWAESPLASSIVASAGAVVGGGGAGFAPPSEDDSAEDDTRARVVSERELVQVLITKKIEPVAKLPVDGEPLEFLVYDEAELDLDAIGPPGAGEPAAVVVRTMLRDPSSQNELSPGEDDPRSAATRGWNLGTMRGGPRRPDLDPYLDPDDYGEIIQDYPNLTYAAMVLAQRLEVGDVAWDRELERLEQEQAAWSRESDLRAQGPPAPRPDTRYHALDGIDSLFEAPPVDPISTMDAARAVFGSDADQLTATSDPEISVVPAEALTEAIAASGCTPLISVEWADPSCTIHLLELDCLDWSMLPKLAPDAEDGVAIVSDPLVQRSLAGIAASPVSSSTRSSDIFFLNQFGRALAESIWNDSRDADWAAIAERNQWTAEQLRERREAIEGTAGAPPAALTLLRPRTDHKAIGVTNDALLVAGGRGVTDEPTEETVLLPDQRVSSRRSTMGGLAGPRAGHVAIGPGASGLLVGGSVDGSLAFIPMSEVAPNEVVEGWDTSEDADTWSWVGLAKVESPPVGKSGGRPAGTGVGTIAVVAKPQFSAAFGYSVVVPGLLTTPDAEMPTFPRPWQPAADGSGDAATASPEPGASESGTPNSSQSDGESPADDLGSLDGLNERPPLV